MTRTWKATTVVVLLLATAAAPAQQPPQSEALTGPRPLRDLADRLQAAWARPVTYEEPLWQHPSDASLEGDPARLAPGPRVRAATLPAAALANRVRSQDAALLKNVVASFNANNSPLNFEVAETGWGLHLLPSRSRNAAGVEAPAVSLLDETVTVLPETRSPFGHLEALAKALSLKTGTRVEAATGMLGMGFDRAFAHADSPPAAEWGTTAAAGPVKARDALVAFLSRSATTMSWRLNCQPAASPASPAFCVLGVDPLHVDRRGQDGKLVRTVLQWDRCVRCPPQQPPPPPPRP